MELITRLLRSIVTAGLIALSIPLVAQAVHQNATQQSAQDDEDDSGDGTERAGVPIPTDLIAHASAPVLRSAGVNADDLARGFQVIMRTQAEAQADLDRRYAIPE